MQGLDDRLVLGKLAAVGEVCGMHGQACRRIGSVRRGPPTSGYDG
jgi:hypothetical protein